MGNNKMITPYHGNKPYIFVSYSHRNMDDAMEIVNQLQSNCYRVWYGMTRKTVIGTLERILLTKVYLLGLTSDHNPNPRILQ